MKNFSTDQAILDRDRIDELCDAFDGKFPIEQAKKIIFEKLLIFNVLKGIGYLNFRASLIFAHPIKIYFREPLTFFRSRKLICEYVLK